MTWDFYRNATQNADQLRQRFADALVARVAQREGRGHEREAAPGWRRVAASPGGRRGARGGKAGG